jgi:hypothetical protein
VSVGVFVLSPKSSFISSNSSLLLPRRIFGEEPELCEYECRLLVVLLLRVGEGAWRPCSKSEQFRLGIYLHIKLAYNDFATYLHPSDFVLNGDFGGLRSVLVFLLGGVTLCESCV